MTQTFPSTNRPARIFDLDGTLADSRWRSEYAEETCASDAVVEWVRDDLVAAHSRGEAILIVTNRREAYIQPTFKWLAAKGIWFDELMCRPTGDTRYGADVKRTAVEALIAKGYRILGAHEDKWRVIEMLTELGIPVTKVDLKQKHETTVQERSNGALYVECICGWDSGYDYADESLASENGREHEESYE
jgi:hypothetical protein